MKKYLSRTSAVLLTLLIIFFGGRGILQIAANSQVDKDINRHLLSTIKPDLTSDDNPFDKDPVTLGDSRVTLGDSQDSVRLGESAAAAPGTFGTEGTIAGIIPRQEQDKIVIVPGTGASAYQSYPGTPAGMASALMELYNNGRNRDFAIHIGTAITMPSFMGLEVPAPAPSVLNISFSALEGKVGTLTLLANYDDPIDHTNTTATTTTIGVINFPMYTYFGTNVIMRNISYSSTYIYMKGHSLTLGYGSYFNTATNFFGGSNNSAITGNPTMTIYSTGTGIQGFYGGGETRSSTLKGNTSIVVYNTSKAPINTIMAGSSLGTVTGDSSLTIHNTSASTIAVVSGGNMNGTSNGNVSIDIHNTGSIITTLYGGTSSGTVTGTVTNTIYNTGAPINNFFGGSNVGTINGDISNVIHNMGGSGNLIMYAGGYGARADDPATINGDISTTIHNLGAVVLKQYYGGTMYGNVSGSITNVLKGTGKFDLATLVPGSSPSGYVYSGGSTYIGGSYGGDVGQSIAGGGLAISNDIDTSLYTSGTVHFAGGNGLSGTTNGGIKNIATASNVFNAGSISSFSGGAGKNAGLIGSGGASDYDGLSAEEAQTRYLARTLTVIKTYGNIDSVLTKGVMSDNTEDGYTRGAGFGGYVEGDVTTTVGTLGKVSSVAGIGIDNSPSNTLNDRGAETDYYIVGGGGNIGKANVIFIKGNTTLDLQNVLARWVYGGNLSGFIVGNSTATLSGGVVDSIMGGGVATHQQWGDVNAIITGGQVDWFTCGGGFNDRYIHGNVTLTITGGTINASVGGTYGMTTDHVIRDNSTVLVTGGDFSGSPRDGDNGFSGGATYIGRILGNSSVTLDFRNSTTPFKLPKGTFITGGRRYDAREDSYLGTEGKNNTIELNIFANAGNDVLNGASIYGDGSEFPYSTQSTKITVNIDAPDSSVGNFYATQYTNISGKNLLRDVTFNIYNLRSIKGLSGGTVTDNFTNVSASNSVNKSTININPPPADVETTKTIAVGDGIVNFTEFNINNTIMEVSGMGGIKNGSGVSAGNHGTTYHLFGKINITNGGGFKISDSAFVSGSMLTVDGKASLTSPSGTGKLIVSDLTIGADDSIHWTKNGGSSLESVTGNWYGQNQGYKVITFNPAPANARKITPYNFTGEDELGAMYLGDNEDSSNIINGHGIAIPGTRVEFKVVGGAGKISHNVDRVMPTDILPLNGSSSIGKDVQVTSGWLSISDAFNGAALTFTPDTVSGSWLKGVKITRSDGAEILIPESTHSNPVEWKVPLKGLSYVVEVTYTNLSELSGRSVMISETEAKNITTAEEIMDYQDISGRPFLNSSIDAALIAEINKPLPDGTKVRSHEVTYTVGTTGNITEGTYFIGVVPDTAVIEMPNRRAAIDANGATMMLAVAKGITEADLATNYTYPMVYLPNGGTVNPTLDSTTIATLNTMVTPASVNATYSYGLTDPTVTLSKTVVVLVIPDGKLVLDTVPELNFGEAAIPGVKTSFWKPSSTTLIVEDSRIDPYGSTWEVILRVTDLVAGTEKISASELVYTNKTSTNGPTGTFPLNTVTPVWESITKAADKQTLVWAISADEGFSVKLDPLTTKLGTYEGTATWSVQVTPVIP